MKQFAVLAVAVAAIAALLPFGATAAGEQLVRLVDGNGTSKAEVDNGKVRVGDGSGPVSVDGRVSQPAVRVLAKGDCIEGAIERVDTLDNPPGRRITGIVLTQNEQGYATGMLGLIAPGETVPMTNLIVERSQYYHAGEAALDFGAGITHPNNAADWTIKCSDRGGGGAAWGRWMVLGYDG